MKKLLAALLLLPALALAQYSGAPYNPNNVAIKGGTVNGTPIGGATPAAGAFTTLSATTPLPATSGGTGNAYVTFAGPTQARTMTVPDAAATLADISTGAWTPTDGSGASLTFATAAGTYVKIGKLVFLSARVTYPVTVNASQAVINIPYVAGVTGHPEYNSTGVIVTSGTAAKCQVDRGSSLLYFYSTGNTAATNAGQSNLIVDFSIVYQTP